MQEVFSRIEQPGVSLHDQEFYELRLYDSEDAWCPAHMLMQSRTMWSEVDGQFMWDEIETDSFPTLNKAQERYAARRSALAAKGFAVLDTDLK
jgi:hypothetical protein